MRSLSKVMRFMGENRSAGDELKPVEMMLSAVACFGYGLYVMFCLQPSPERTPRLENLDFAFQLELEVAITIVL